jgi:uncharacterized protein (DUF305 family)
MTVFTRSLLVCAIAFTLGWFAHALATPQIAVAADQDCAQMHAMMQKQIHSPADKALLQAMMGTMHQSMMNVNLTGNADTDFMLLMIPHHQSAIAMSKVELQYGKNARVRALATSIISAQQEEIDEMRGWLSKAETNP